jgi:hypothetical protein
MSVATFEHHKKQITLGLEEDLTNGGITIEKLEIDGQDCTNALEFGGLYDLFEGLLHGLKVEKDDDI